MKAETPQGRLLFLDVFRGLTIAGMILVNSPGNETAYAQLDHSAWNGCTFTDLVFPFFVFIVGVSLAFSMARRLSHGESRQALFLQVFRRSVIIFGLGLLLNGFPYYHLSSIRIPGVLQRIALCYFFAALLCLTTRVQTQGIIALLLLVGYWLIMTRIPVPGYGVGILTKEGNLAAYVDRLLFSGHMYRLVYDPEGLLSTFPAVATALTGSLAGAWLLSGRSAREKTRGMLFAGIIAMMAGWIWGFWFPINKALWTSSYVLWTSGLVLVTLALCYWLIEIKGWRGWSKPFEIFGVNAIAAYVLHILGLKIQNLISLPQRGGVPGNLRIFLSEHLFGWASPHNASLFYALSYTLLWLVILWGLHRRRILIKI